MSDWLPHALNYSAQWLDFQMRLSQQPGCVFAAALNGELKFERAFGKAELTSGDPLTPRHRFRVASHSKTFTAAAIMRLREQQRLGLDDVAGHYVAGLRKELGEATLGQLLSHTAGLMRDGADSGHWQDQQPFFDEAALRRELERPLVLQPGERLKYSNLGFGLLGLVIASVTGEPYGHWMTREIVEAAGLTETAPDLPSASADPMATGHGGKLPLGRFAVPGHNPTNALSAATGFVSTAGDLVRFFGQLDPAAPRSILSAASRREMTRPHWRHPHTEADLHYGLGTICGAVGKHAFFGHSGAFQGFLSRTCVVPDWGVALAIVTNAVDGPANAWMDGVLHILNRFADRGAPEPDVAEWKGRWWTIWGAIDLVPMGNNVLVAQPSALAPFMDASELTVASPGDGRIALANGFGSHGEPARLILSADGAPATLRLGGTTFLPEAAFVTANASRAGQVDPQRSAPQ
jgi:D-alanyl-D-alanine carboxypeptidase